MNNSLSLDPTLRNLDACACCDGLTLEAPIEVHNRPGLRAIAARVGTHGTFKASLLARLASRDFPQLKALGIRDDDDASIAWLDACATLADVLTFYQERIAHESYLRTATERRSLRELARLIGYELRPGVAASAALAFTLEDAAGAPARTPIAIGTRVQSIPGPGQTPQTFETVEAIDARPEWNAIAPRLGQPQPIVTTLREALVLGLAANVKPGDTVLVVAGAGANDREVKRVRAVDSDALAGTTRIRLEDDPPDPLPLFLIALPLATFAIAPLKLTTSQVHTSVISRTWSHANLVAQARVQKWSLPSLKLNLKWQILRPFLNVEKGVFALRQKASIFGHNAPKYLSLPASQRLGERVIDAGGNRVSVAPVYPTSWEGRSLASEPGAPQSIDLDTTYSRVVPGGFVILETTTARGIFRIDDVSEVTRSDFTLNAKVTRLRVTHVSGGTLSAFTLRSTTVHLESEKLPLAELPVTDPVSVSPVSLDGPYPELAVGQRVVLQGEPVDLAGVTLSEALTIADAKLVDGFTWLTFKEGPQNTYVRRTVRFNANVALATHGERVSEVLGSGDSTQAFQKFALRQPPLTWVSARNPAGALSTLEIRVNDLLWTEVPSFFNAGPDDRVYLTRTTEEGGTVVQFGDGRHGARLPTGQENVRATYRKGMGVEGLVDAGQLSLLQSRPLGVRGVVNPVAAGGLADRESLEDARTNAPLTVMTLDRIVSLLDYRDFARAFSGVAKSHAAVSWSSIGRRIFVTVAGTDGAAIEDTTDLFSNLLSAMRAAGDPQVPLRVKTYTPAFFSVAGEILCTPDRLATQVFQEIDNALRSAFSFPSRDFAQPVARSEVIAILHSIPGIVAVNLSAFHRVDQAVSVETLLSAQGPRAGATDDLGAELLLLDGRPLDFTVVPANA